MSLFSSLFKKTPTDVKIDTLFSVDAKHVDEKLLRKSELISKNIPEDNSEDISENNSENISEDTSEDISEDNVSDSEEPPKKKKTKINDENETLEADYYNNLIKETLPEPETKSEARPELETATEIKSLSTENDNDKTQKTIFIGNVPISVVTSKPTYNKFKALFSKVGKINSIRFRSISFNEALPRKVAFSQKKFNDKRETLNAYIVYDTQEASKTAPSFYNAKVFENYHLRVDHVAHPAPKDNKRTIFVGNLDFDEVEESLWTYFIKQCGDVESVRIVRDAKTNIGKGFGLVQFKDTLSVNKALMLDNKPISNEKSRKLRILRAKAHSKPSILSPNHVDNAKSPKRGIKSKSNVNVANTKRKRSGIKESFDNIVIEGERSKKGNVSKKAGGYKKKARITDRSRKFKRAHLSSNK